MTRLFTYRLLTYLSIITLLDIGCSKSSNNQPDDLPGADQYITWNFDGGKGAMTSPNDSIGSARYANDTHIIGQSTTDQNAVYFIFNGNRDAGIYYANFADLYINLKTYTNSSDPLLITVTKYGNSGDYIIGTYSGKIRDTSGNLYPINGNFKLRTM